MNEQPKFEWDVFLSHSSSDKDVVRDIARQLADDKTRVWFDEWIIQPGDHIPSAIERGLQGSCVLVLVLSESALNSDWVTLERQTAMFRDPVNKHRRFVPVRIDDCEIPEMLAGFRYLDFRGEKASRSYPELLQACVNQPFKDVAPTTTTYHSIFTPGAPPTRNDLLVGREEAVSELNDYLLSPGIHPIVVGPRGIGKTSLVRVAMSQQNVNRLSRLEANTVSDFHECCEQICHDLDITNDTKKGFTPASFLRVLRTSSTPAVVSIDELDDLPKNSDIPKCLAKFAKAASNHAAELSQKFIFSGISRDAHNLFRGHLSASRNHPVIYLDRIREPEFQRFLQMAAEMLQVHIPNTIGAEIGRDADGFPYYMHQVGFHMLACFSRDTTTNSLTLAHFEEGKRRAADSAFAHYLRRYKFTIYKIDALQRSILQYLVTSKRRHNPYAELEKSIKTKSRKSLDEVKAAFRWLTDNNYISYRNADKTVSVQESLLIPFLKIKLKLRTDESDSDSQMRLPFG